MKLGHDRHIESIYFPIRNVSPYRTRKQPIMMKIGKLICKKERDSVYSSSRRVEFVELDPEPTEDMLMKDSDYRNVFI